MKKIPEFRTEEEEVRFWDEHDSMEFIEELEPVEIELSPELEDKILSKRELKKPITWRMLAVNTLLFSATKKRKLW